MERILVLGGTGFIGGVLLAALAARGTPVLWTARPEAHSDARPPAGAALPPPLRVDDLARLDLAVLDRADVIVDLVSHGRGRLARVRDIAGRIAGHARLVDAIANRGWRGHYVFLSSGGTIYGTRPPPVCTEATPIAPFSDYALEKAFVELHLSSVAAAGVLRTTILRVANAYGETQRARPGFGVVPAIVTALRDGTPFTLYGTGAERRDYLHVDDVVDAILAAIDSGGAGLLTIGSGVGTATLDLVDLCAAISGRAITVEPARTVTPEPLSIVLDPALARARLGWQPRIALGAGLARVLARAGLVAGAAGFVAGVAGAAPAD